MTDNDITYQTRTYLRLLGLQVGILVNFNTDDILDDSIHRIINNQSY